MNPKMVRLLHEGFSISTLENLTEGQLNLLYEKVKTPKSTSKCSCGCEIKKCKCGPECKCGCYNKNNKKESVVDKNAKKEPKEQVAVTAMRYDLKNVDQKNKFLDDTKNVTDKNKVNFDPTTDTATVSETELQEKSKSKKQQQFFGIVRGMQKGDIPKKGEAGKKAKEMDPKDVKDFASTKHKGLPKKVESKEGKEKFIQKATKKMETKGTEGKFGRWCKKEGLDSDGEVTKKCISAAMKSEDPAVVKMANFAKNIGGFKGAEHKKKTETKENIKKLEEGILKLIEDHLPPHTTKGELLKTIKSIKR